MNKRKIATVCGLTLFCVVMILPPIIHGYVYPSLGDDSAEHLKILDRIQAHTFPLLAGYFGYILVGYPLVFISDLMGWGIDSMFLWFNYIALILVGLVLYFVLSKLVNKKAGWLGLLLTLFCSQGILFLFYFGLIFNVISIGIIFPLLLYFTVKYLTEKKVYQLVLTILFVMLFGSFHTNGIYLPFVAMLTTMVYVIYRLIRKQSLQVRVLGVGFGMVILSGVALWLLVPNTIIVAYKTIGYLGGMMAVPVLDYLLGIVSLTILVILSFTLLFAKDLLRNINKPAQITLCILSSMTIMLAISAFAKLSADPFRQALDLATVLALWATVSIGVFMERYKGKLMLGFLVIIVGIGLYHNVPTWFGYNSAVRPADEQAIAYVNTLDYKVYNCGAEVAPWIYDRFTKAKYDKDSTDLVIVRSVPMTPRSTVGNYWYGGHGIKPDDNFALVRTFSDDKVEVGIYERR